ncbi:MAG: hypothetical protein ACK5LS_10750 [Propioniciclava sp.]
MTRVRVVLSQFPPGTGWDPVTLMGELLAESLSAELVRVPHAATDARWRRGLAVLPRRRGTDVTIVVAPQPVHLAAMLDAHHWLSGSAMVAGWVIDAFWTDRIPRMARRGGHLDHLFVTDAEVMLPWRQATGVPTSWLPWGTDAWRHGSRADDRPVDLQRIGRQPAGWDHDETVAARLARDELTFAGRPPFAAAVADNLALVHRAMARAKYVLAFSNRFSPAAYTHPDREYLTGRWLDALANGAGLAGIPPRCAAAERLLWPGALVELGIEPETATITTLREAANAWTPGFAAQTHRRALQTLDWRWRFGELVTTLGLDAPVLTEQLAAIERECSPGSDRTAR